MDCGITTSAWHIGLFLPHPSVPLSASGLACSTALERNRTRELLVRIEHCYTPRSDSRLKVAERGLNAMGESV